MVRPPASTDLHPVVIDLSGLQALIDALVADGRRVIGPTVHDGAVVYDEIGGIGDLPAGCGDEQGPGRYRLRARDDDALFGYAAGSDSWKRFLFPPVTVTWRAQVGEDTVAVAALPAAPRYAFLGVRACDLAAIAIQDRVLVHTAFPDRDYAARRESAFLIAVNCSTPAATCFCSSMGAGPRVGPGYDLALTELVDGGRSRFLVEIGSERGAGITARISAPEAAPADREAAAAVWTAASAAISKTIPADGLGDVLIRNLEHPRWDTVAARCLGCANCTMVCPTCFCVDFREAGGLSPNHSEQHRTWASCFAVDHSQLHGGSMRWTTRSRYRQWMTHKLATWQEQFGTLGCVGCGRCIAWCPVGIDITEEATAIRATDGLTRLPAGATP
jgi:ferredoxin